MRPKTQSKNGLLHLRYHLNQRVHTSAIYPLSSPNGSSIILCGHEHGLLVIWRGGRPLKTSKSNTAQETDGRESSQDVMALDNSDEDVGSTETEEVEFEDEEEEYDSERPYEPIIQHLDIPFGTAVYHLAFPRLLQLFEPERHPLSPPLLQEKLVVALACGDNSLRILTLPLAPPSDSYKMRSSLRNDISLCMVGNGSWGEELIIVANAQGHQSLPKGVSIAFASRSSLGEEDDEDEDQERSSTASDELDLLLASHSSDLSGTLMVHRIPVAPDGMTLEDVSQAQLWRSQMLSSRAATIDLHVPSSSSEHQSPRVLIAQSNGLVKIYECLSESTQDRGAWSLSLYPGSLHHHHHHHRVLDAKWILGGKMVAVLAADGKWGLWDISPAHGSKGISGSIPTKFTISGWISNSFTTSTPSLPKSQPMHSHLAPMTPGTRKTRQEALFSGPLSKAPTTSTAGGLSVSLAGPSSTATAADESLLIWHGAEILTIPSLRAYCQHKVRGSAGNNSDHGDGGGAAALDGNSASGQIREVAPIETPGEQRTGVAAFPAQDSPSTLRPSRPAVLVSGERSLVILAAPRLAEERRVVALIGDAAPTRDVVLMRDRRDEDEKLLRRGELDVGGLDRVMDFMEEGRDVGAVEVGQKRVGFAM